MEINDEQKKEAFNKYKEKAGEYVEDKSKLNDIVEKAKQVLEEMKGPAKEVYEKIKILISVITDWINGSYKDIPYGSIVAIIGGLLYFISPIDIIPDFIPVAGYLDDVAVIAFVVNQISSDLDKYKIWKDSQGK